MSISTESVESVKPILSKVVAQGIFSKTSRKILSKVVIMKTILIENYC